MGKHQADPLCKHDTFPFLCGAVIEWIYHIDYEAYIPKHTYSHSKGNFGCTKALVFLKLLTVTMHLERKLCSHTTKPENWSSMTSWQISLMRF